VAGSYVPRVLAGPPAGGHEFLVLHADNIKIFYPARLSVKPFEEQIRIMLKKFLFLKWLELEGARAIVCAPAEE
jgi:hypothetical protein